ncbi:MFS transporter [Mesorhizobium sp. M2D.F.Ca.ET.185.01.1.1]|uniref:MFS transporter n=1 Tax=unclassified Mesorhizobium TaxID=325217 RepID=UPI000FCAD7BF|nr:MULTISPECIES: MFS transporter [unclassified Mesorhizobium]TGP82510.1 MFS transporter [bacterium M00.F.Ca.ET.227.01.1.1]TGP94265.1 MFS transporter [bacterium M00.F.Ca.ET.221.01.1.1]TGP97720.1 MFS transporter [bacterium M00.F.Ca.ET.222.01.1.1]TGU11969.1 MFS transporter [bacterium M00.F.Ca.ET.163.01.1.1]TGU35776.1 MFS transporter [bacterium M00.F.Ca.ET.156.01.1.1]TGU48701.1 MFS transporter [bacterium M00.F.Ca.ET.146.01.1.1]TGV70504.1 MFS transporter [Mesorhizobium sp. M2D.F.Ca.ET.160.01.1.1]
MTLMTRTGPAGKWLVLLAVCLAAMTMPLSFTGPAVALSRIAADLGGSPIELNWVTNAFMLTFGASLMAAGALADNHGRKRIFLIGLATYVLAALGATLASGIVWFDIFRALQGIGGAAAFAGGASALAQEFEGQSRLRAFSFLGTSFGIGLAFGPIASGLLIDAFGWRAIFLLVALLAVAAAVLRAVSESRDPDATGLDWAGAGTFTLALAALTCGVLLAPQNGWADPLVIALLGMAAICFGAFVIVERRVRRPMLDLTLFRFPRFVGVQFLAAAPAYAFVVLLVLLPIRFIGIEGMSEIKAGQLMICLSGPLLILPLLAGQLARWIAPATICGVGLLVAAAGLVWLSRVPAVDSALVSPLVLIGVGIALPWGLMDGLAVSVVPKERAGMAVGIFNTTRVACEGVALAIVMAVLSGFAALQLGDQGLAPPAEASSAAQLLVTGNVGGTAQHLPLADASALIQAYETAFDRLLVVLATITLLTAIVVFLGLRRGSSPERDAAPLPAGQEG